MQVLCESRQKQFTLDEPAELGGTDIGMNPVEALLNALNACKCIVAKSFAGKMGIELEAFSIDSVCTLDPDGFMGINPDAPVGLKNIELTYNVKSSASDAEIEKLIEFVEIHCPVRATIITTPELTAKINRQ